MLKWRSPLVVLAAVAGVAWAGISVMAPLLPLFAQSLRATLATICASNRVFFRSRQATGRTGLTRSIGGNSGSLCSRTSR